jgi:hypothetical protein
LIVLAAALGAATGAAAEQPVSAPAYLHHDVELRFDLAEHHVGVVDRVTVPPGVTELRLGPDLQLTGVALEQGALRREPTVATWTRDPESGDQILDLEALGPRAGWTLVLEYDGTFHQPTDAIVFSRENVAGEIEATVGDEGIYLASDAGWLPSQEGALATHKVSCNTPAGYEPVTQGVRTRHELAGDRLQTTWEARHPSDGLNLVAARYTITEARAGRDERVTVYTFLLADDARLRDLYVERTQHYIELYETMLGPYPYGKFATVECWFPAGYGMPSYTLLGSQVMRLPFIPTTSFGHEICHSWWGNSVFVDPSEGNWCEGLTTYCADYHYKVEESPEAARGYRRNLLKDYAAYVSEGEHDLPLRDFKSRHSGATRAVGYGKSMFVFHQLDRALGHATFEAALRDIVREYTFRSATWSALLAAFAARGDTALTGFKEQWIDRTGAPVLRLEDARREGDEVVFTVAQSDPPYTLQIPVVIASGSGEQEFVIRSSGLQQEYRLEAPGATRLRVDPDFHVFRRLDPREIEPTISQVLAAPAPVFSLPPDAPDFAAAGEAFARAFTETEFLNLFHDGGRPVDMPPERAASVVFLRPTSGEIDPDYVPKGLTIAAGAVYLDGRRYSLADYDLVYTVADPFYPHVTDLVVLSGAPERLERLGSRLGHYGKYSWLLLPNGAGPVLKGNWPQAGDPLAADLAVR